MASPRPRRSRDSSRRSDAPLAASSNLARMFSGSAEEADDAGMGGDDLFGLGGGDGDGGGDGLGGLVGSESPSLASPASNNSLLTYRQPRRPSSNGTTTAKPTKRAASSTAPAPAASVTSGGNSSSTAARPKGFVYASSVRAVFAFRSSEGRYISLSSENALGCVIAGSGQGEAASRYDARRTD